MVNFSSNSPSETKKGGEVLARKFLKIKKPRARTPKENKFPTGQASSARGKKKRALVLGLEGDFGGGKTTFLQGFAKGLGIKEKILSPTFVILKKFKIPKIKKKIQKSKTEPRSGGTKMKKRTKPSSPSRMERGGRRDEVSSPFENFYHIDCYRLRKPKEILTLGFKEIIYNPRNIVAIEWADHIEKILPKDTLILKFKFVDKNRREIKVVVK